ncbi:hypothetical protein B0T25DRAFT_565444 [Lasiosphaeria hispida]|uniref:Ubiquitin 3 binding protein But2 C-terminal domain-containing protein n=1 Tax=Lasiosphaeria hispida TaxID=260671 RepID=A0AAJ0HSQ9_9PEZI|nr:hypothetical protein B0T25DRAFT_565444 [Lasiosphaeria hispida]
MAKLTLLLALTALGASALPSSKSSRTCGQAHAPYSILSVSKHNISESAKPYDPYIAVNQIFDRSSGFTPYPLFKTITPLTQTLQTGQKSGVATLVRFTPGPSSVSCKFALNFSPARYGEVQIGGVADPNWEKPPQLAIYKVANLPAGSLPSYDQLEIVPGPWGSAMVNHAGPYSVNAEPCGQAGDYLVDIPMWVAGNMGISWKNDVEGEFGLFLEENC